MNNTRKKELKRRQAIAILNGMAIKYPKGSFIVFSTSHEKGEEPATTSCSWYDKVGGKCPLKHRISRPPEWQNIPYEEAKKIAEMFDDSMFCNLVYV